MLLSLCVVILSQVSGEPAFPLVNDLPLSRRLPDPLINQQGEAISDPMAWAQQRSYIRAMLLHYEYGPLPPAPVRLSTSPVEREMVLEGAAELRRFKLKLGPQEDLLVQAGCFIPQGKPGPFPVILALEPVWIPSLREVARTVVQSGYIFAGLEKLDLDPDQAERREGLHRVFPEERFATLAVWAWGIHRMVDYLQHQDYVDSKRIAVTGHSRSGKSALLAAAFDTRIALVAPHASGAGGAGSFRLEGKGCETLEAITDPKRFHYWFHPRLREFAGREQRLPFDQHFLAALVAPRALLCMEGLEDRWANPSGVQYMSEAAQPVFDLLGASEKNARYFRPGGHDMTLEDWRVLLDFADHVFLGKASKIDYKQRPFPPRK